MIGQYVQGKPADLGGFFRLHGVAGGCSRLRASGFADEVSRVAEEDAEGHGVAGIDMVLAVLIDGDEELLEEELVEHAANMFGGLSVRVPRVLGDVKRDANEPVGFGEIRAERVEAAVCGCEFRVEALLFASEHLDGDGVVVVGLEELPLTSLDGLLCGLEEVPLGVGVRSEKLQAVAQQSFKIVAEVRGEADAVVQVLDEGFDVFDLHGAECAIGAFGVASEAGVVRVGCAVPVLGDLHDHAEFAVSAVHRGLEVVVVFNRAFAVDLLLQDGLYLLEGGLIDERRVVPGVRDAFESRDARVVRVREHRVDVADLDGLFGQACGWGSRKAAPVEFLGEGAQGVVAGGVGGECPG